MIDGAIKKLSEKCAQMIADNKLKFRELRQFNRVDGISGKKRDICQESPLQQVFANLAVSQVRDKSRARKEFHIFSIVQSSKTNEWTVLNVTSARLIHQQK